MKLTNQRFLKTLTFVLAFTLTAWYLPASAQVVTPEWEISLPSKLKWMEINDWGVVIAAAEDGLYGVDPTDGKQLWTIAEMSNVKIEDYEAVAGTPLFIIKNKSGDDRVMIVNGLSGVLVFDSKKAGIEKVISNQVIVENQGVLVAYSNETGDGAALFDFLDGREIWNTALEKAKKTRIQPTPVIDKDGNILYANGPSFYKLNGTNGEIMWQVSGKKNIIDFFTSPEEDNVVIVSGAPSNEFAMANETGSASITSTSVKFQMQGYRTFDGSECWKNPIIYPKSGYAGVMLGEKDFFVLHTLAANKVNYETGATIWKKEKFGTGGASIVSVFETEDGFVYVASDGDGRTTFNYVDPSGSSIWKKRANILGQILHVKKTDDAFFYITTEGANFLSLSEGKEIWTGDKRLSSNNTPVSYLQEDEDTYLLSTADKLIRIELREKDWSVVAAGFGFQQELPTALEKVEDGYLLSGNQNIMLLGTDGKKRFQQFYKMPDQSKSASAGLKLLSVASTLVAVAAIDAGATNAVYGSMSGNDAQLRKADQQLALASFSADMAGGAAAFASVRYSTSAASSKTKLILTEKDDLIGFVKIDKNTGFETGMIVTDDRTPDFVIDDVANHVYVKLKGNRIASFKL